MNNSYRRAKGSRTRAAAARSCLSKVRAENKQLALLIGSRVLSRRKHLGLTQVELQRRADLPNTSVSRLEHGRGLPRVANLVAIARALAVSTHWLITGEEFSAEGHSA